MKHRILAINGSAARASSNYKLLQNIATLTSAYFDVTIFDGLTQLPHFDPELSVSNPPPAIVQIRQQIEAADGIIICTPEYVFSIPAGLKNLIEWCVSTTIFSHKPTGLITAAADGKKGHAELLLIMQTVEAAFTTETTLLVPGVKGKINGAGEIIHQQTMDDLISFINSFKALVTEPAPPSGT